MTTRKSKILCLSAVAVATALILSACSTSKQDTPTPHNLPVYCVLIAQEGETENLPPCADTRTSKLKPFTYRGASTVVFGRNAWGERGENFDWIKVCTPGEKAFAELNAYIALLHNALEGDFVPQNNAERLLSDALRTWYTARFEHKPQSKELHLKSAEIWKTLSEEPGIDPVLKGRALLWHGFLNLRHGANEEPLIKLSRDIDPLLVAPALSHLTLYWSQNNQPERAKEGYGEIVRRFKGDERFAQLVYIAETRLSPKPPIEIRIPDEE